jgi:hypothetical protein
MRESTATKKAVELLENIYHLMRALRRGEETTLHHLYCLLHNVLDLLRECHGRFDDIIDKYEP